MARDHITYRLVPRRWTFRVLPVVFVLIGPFVRTSPRWLVRLVAKYGFKACRVRE